MLYEDCLPEVIQDILSQDLPDETIQQTIDSHAKAMSGMMCDEVYDEQFI